MIAKIKCIYSGIIWDVVIKLGIKFRNAVISRIFSDTKCIYSGIIWDVVIKLGIKFRNAVISRIFSDT